MISHWSLSDSKSPGLFSVFWLILIMLLGWSPLILLFLSPPVLVPILWWLPSAPITIGITVAFMFHSFSILEQGPGTYLSFCFLSILLFGQLGQQIPQLGKFSSFLFFILFVCVCVCVLTIIRSGHLAEIRRSVCFSKIQRSLCVSFSRTDSGLCIYRLFIWSNFYYYSQLKKACTLTAFLC